MTSPFTPSNLARIVSTLVAIVLATGTVSAQSGSWTVDASGLWSNTANWSAGIMASGTSNTANFNTVNLTADRTVSLDSARTIGSIIFGDPTPGSAGGWTLDNNGNAANVLTLAVSSGNPTITVNTLGTGKVATINAQIAGTQGFAKAGAGTLVLTSSNSYTGFTRVTAGTLVASDSSVYTGATGASSILGSNSGIVFSNNTTLDLRVNGNNNAGTQSIGFSNYLYTPTAGVNFTVNVDRQSATGGTNKTISLSSSTNLFANGTNLNVTGSNGFNLYLAAVNIGTSTTSGSVTIAPTTANITLGNVSNQGSTNAHTLILSGTSTGNAITGTIADTGVNGILSIEKANSSTWTFTNANTYSGGTIITAGSLILSGAGSLGSGDVTIGANGSLDISGITGGTFTLSSTQVLNGNGSVNATGKILVANGTFNPGSSPGDFDVTGGFTLGGTSLSNFEIEGITSGLFDSLQVTGALSLGGTLNLLTSYAFQLGDSVDILDWGTMTGTFGAITGTDLGGGLSWDTSNLYSTGVITVVPEPATWALIAIGGTLMMATRRRRQN